MLDIRTPSPQPFFGTQVGDVVVMRLDVLVELARHAPGLPPTWLTLPAGTEGRVLGYRERAGEAYAIVEVLLDRRVVVFVREEKLGVVPPRPRVMHERRPRRQTRRNHR